MGLKFAPLAASSWLTYLSGSHARLIGNSSTPVVDLGYAQYKGNTSLAGTNVFYGISYAQAPIGELRWQPPRDIEANNDYDPTHVLNAESPGPSCVQGTPAWRPPQRGNLTVNFPVTGEEDCLRLDVVAGHLIPADWLFKQASVKVKVASDAERSERLASEARSRQRAEQQSWCSQIGRAHV